MWLSLFFSPLSSDLFIYLCLLSNLSDGSTKKKDEYKKYLLNLRNSLAV